jgi:hypothetical protein
MGTILATLEHGSCKAEIYETKLPGQFSVHYCDLTGATLAEEPLTGVSSYRQREQEIIARMEILCAGGKVKLGQMADVGEY